LAISPEVCEAFGSELCGSELCANFFWVVLNRLSVLPSQGSLYPGMMEHVRVDGKANVDVEPILALR